MTCMCKTSKNKSTDLISSVINIQASLFLGKYLLCTFVSYSTVQTDKERNTKALHVSAVVFFHIQSQHISLWNTAFNGQVLESSICSGLRTKGSINEGFIGYINNHLCLLLWEACDMEYH